jgi:flagella basal body P-ring formation protein FlgA
MSNRLLIAVLVAFFALLVINARAAEPLPVMKAEVTVASGSVRLGDLIDNAGAAASIAVFHAPALGTSGTIQTHRVLEVAREHGIANIDTRGLNEIVVYRASRTLTLADFEVAAAQAAMRYLGIASPEDIAVRFDRDVSALQVEPSVGGDPRLTRFTYDPHTKRFEGLVELNGSVALRKNPARISGTLEQTAEVAVLARSVTRGETLREADILIERRPRSEIAADAVVARSVAIGKAARRSLRAGSLLRPGDLVQPDLVHRNDLVTILFEMPGITLTARGKALDAGADGDLVSVVNPQSNRTLHATVRGPGLVVVSPQTRTADASPKVR